jgi:hypothetical protein
VKKIVLTGFFLIAFNGLLSAATPCGPYADFSAFTASSNLYNAMNAKSNIQCGTTSPVGVVSGTAGVDFYIITGTGSGAGSLYAATVTGSPATWVLIGTAGVPFGNVIVVDSVNGNDGTGQRGNLAFPFKTVRGAISASGISSGDLIQIGPGTFNETTSPQTPVVFPSGVSAVCASPTSTTLENDNPTTTLMIGFIPGSNSSIRNCTLQGNYNSTTLFEGPVGTDANTYGNIVTNVTLINDVVLGGTDGIYLRDSVAVQTPLYWRIIDCTVTAAWDTFVFAEPGGGSWPAVVDVFNTKFFSTYNGASGISWIAINNNSLGTITNIFGGRLTIAGGAAVNTTTAAVKVSRGTVNLYGVVTSLAVQSGTYSSLIASNNGIINANAGVAFDPTLTNISQTPPAGVLNIIGPAITFGTPASSSDPCAVPQIKFDAAFIYTCTAVNTWRRAATSSF